MEHLSEHIARFINERRQSYGMTTTELAKRVNMSPIALRAVFRGERNLMADEFVLLCSYFRIEIGDMYPVRLGKIQQKPQVKNRISWKGFIRED